MRNKRETQVKQVTQNKKQAKQLIKIVRSKETEKRSEKREKRYLTHKIYLMLESEGGLAQLARAPALHAGGHRFESVILHNKQGDH